MAWTHNNRIIQKGNQLVVNYAGQADNSDLTAYQIVDISAYELLNGNAPSRTRVERALIVMDSMFYKLEWHRTANVLIAGGGGGIYMLPFVLFGETPGNDIQPQPHLDPDTGETGDIILTTLGAAVGTGVGIQMLVTLIE